ncbi:MULTISPECIES: alpha/beta fold hydrolase [Streptacidiphilus]|uniref:Alpha/beta fold hydrolase n=1 Tax=Streptacidiphilus cavernicola TaxID=3342716 RepID=A0ABV6UI69_9ACTN|nr:alpha/beta fold hydrolase [Streptacidiphilus jeojiense]
MHRSPTPTVVLVHGANHDGWCWTPVLERLDRAGVRARTVDLPLDSYDADTRAVRDAVADARVHGPVVLVAHSYGGLPVSAGGHAADRLVFVAARMPLPGRSPAALTPEWNHPGFRESWSVRADGAVTLTAAAREVLYSGSPPALAESAARRWRPMWSRVPEQPLADPAWCTVPSLYVVCLGDRTVRVEAQRACAERAEERVALDCDHSPFFSAPDELTEVLVRQAASVGSDHDRTDRADAGTTRSTVPGW